MEWYVMGREWLSGRRSAFAEGRGVAKGGVAIYVEAPGREAYLLMGQASS